MRVEKFWTFVVAIGFATAACENTEETTGPSADDVAVVEISPELDTLVALGTTLQFTAVAISRAGDTLPNPTFEWSSSDSAVASIDGTGLASAIGPGRSVVRATVDSVGGRATLLVVQQVETVSISASRDTLDFIGDTTTLAAEAVDAGGASIVGARLIWTTSDAQIATVTSAGVVTGRANGTAIVSASFRDRSDSISIAVRQLAAAVRIRLQPGPADSGDVLSTQPSVEIVDVAGSVVSDANEGEVTASIAEGGGTLGGTLAAPVVDGVATFSDLAVNGLPGPRRLTLSAPGLDAATSDEFAIGTDGIPTQIVVEAGNGQTSPIEETLPLPLTVSIRDDVFNPILGVTVTFAVTSGQASLGTPSTITRANGLATTTVFIGPEAGTITMEAQTSGLTPAVFSATAVAGAARDSIYNETFTAADGSPWPSPWEEVAESAILVADVQNERARLAAQDGSMTFERLARMRHLAIDEQDVEIEFTVEFTDIDRQGLSFSFRHNGAFLNQTDPRGLGYTFFVEGGSATGERFSLWTELDGALRRHAQSAVLVENGLAYRVRYQVKQMSAAETRQRGKIWLATDPEPFAWTVEATTSFAELQSMSGGMVLDIFNYGGSTEPIFVDDVTVRRLSGIP